MDYILDFCRSCGMLLEEGMGNRHRDEQFCGNCGNEVYQSEQRIRGVFGEEDAEALYTAYGLVCEGTKKEHGFGSRNVSAGS